MMSKILIVGDCHIRPDTDIIRFKYLGNLVAEERPDHIVFIGDFMDCISLNKYEKRLRDMTKEDYQKDVKYAHGALRLFCKPVSDLQKKQKWNKKKVYRPKAYITLGNHEQRYDDRIKEGLSWLRECQSPTNVYRKYGLKVYPFSVPLNLLGTNYVHYLQNNGTSYATSGTAEHIRKQAGCSIVVGHSHQWDISIFRDVSGNPCNSLVAGKFFADGQQEDYARQSNLRWSDNCVTLLHIKEDRDWDFERISLTRIKEWYS